MKRKFNLSSDIPVGNKKDNLIQKDENNLENMKETAEDNCGCSCSCGDSELSQTPSSSSSTETMMENTFEKQQMQKERERKEDKKAKILILIGLTLTIPLVILELKFYDLVGDTFLFGYLFYFYPHPSNFS